MRPTWQVSDSFTTAAIALIARDAKGGPMTGPELELYRQIEDLLASLPPSERAYFASLEQAELGGQTIADFLMQGPNVGTEFVDDELFHETVLTIVNEHYVDNGLMPIAALALGTSDKPTSDRMAVAVLGLAVCVVEMRSP